MALNSIEIANNALTHIGSATIASLGENSKEARLCNARYDSSRRAVLRAYPWPFALIRVVLDTPTGNVPAYGFSKEFALPTGCLRVVHVDVGGGNYRIESGKILCDADSVDLQYINNVTDTTKFDPIFDDALSLYLAWSICISLVQSDTLRESLWRQYLAALKLAKHVSATENPAKALESNALIEARVNPAGRLVRDPMT